MAENDNTLNGDQIVSGVSPKKQSTITAWLEGNEIFQFFAEDTSTRLAILTAIIAIASFLAQALMYSYKAGYLSVYGLSIDRTGYSAETGIIGFFIRGIQALLFIFPIRALQIVFEFAFERIELNHLVRRELNENLKVIKKKIPIPKMRGHWIATFSIISIVAVLDLLLVPLILIDSSYAMKNIWVWLTIGGILLAAQVLFALVFIGLKRIEKAIGKKTKKNTDNESGDSQTTQTTQKQTGMKSKNSAIWDMAFIIMLSAMYTALAFASGVSSANRLKTYPIINNEYAVVHQSSERYWTVSVRISGETAILNTKNHRVFPIDEHETASYTFKDVTILNQH